MVQAVDFIDEKDIALVQARQDGRQIAFALQDRARRDAQAHVHFMRDDARERRFPQPGRRIEEAVVERLLALARGFDEDAQVFLHAFLPDELVERLRPQRLLDRLFVGDSASRHPRRSLSGIHGFPASGCGE